MPQASTGPFTAWEDGPYFGNGLVGGLFTYVFEQVSPSTVVMQIGRTDVWDQRKNTSVGYYHGGLLQERLPIGQFELVRHLVLPLRGALRCTMQRSWPPSPSDGEGNLTLRALAPHTEAEVLIVEMNATTASLLQSIVNPASSCSRYMKFVPAISESTRHGPPKDYQPNPPAVCSVGCSSACAGGAKCTSGEYSPGCFHRRQEGWLQ